MEDRIPREHPLRRVRLMADRALADPWTYFAALYARRGRPSIPPERLLRDTHESKSDPEARLFKKSVAGQAQPSFLRQDDRELQCVGDDEARNQCGTAAERSG
jgi:hypothetical protein